MNHKTQVLNPWRNRLSAILITLNLLLGGIAGCGQVSTRPVASVTAIPPTPPTTEATMPSEWKTFNGGTGECAYTISYPPDMESGTGGWQHTWILRYFDLVMPPPEVAENYIYVSVLPEGVQTGGVGVIFNYEPAEVETLQNMEIGESKTLRNDPDTARENTYTRLPDMIIADQAAQAYENTNPSNSPAGRKEVRYYFRDNGCAYLIGAYLNATGSDQPGAITEELFDQIIATFDLIP